MTHLTDTPKKYFFNSFIAGVAAGFILLPASVLADDDKAPPSGRSSGSRGCSLGTAPTSSSVPAIILLSPNHQRGQTVSTRPVFAWFVRDKVARPLAFRLYEVEQDRFKLIREIQSETLKSSQGIMVLSLSGSESELTTGKRYRWQVEMICDPNRPSGNLFAQAEVDVVPMQPALKQRLKQGGDRSSQVKLLAEANLWYDALKVAFSESDKSSKLQDFQLSLINKIAVNDTEQQLLSTSAVRSIRR